MLRDSQFVSFVSSPSSIEIRWNKQLGFQLRTWSAFEFRTSVAMAPNGWLKRPWPWPSAARSPLWWWRLRRKTSKLFMGMTTTWTTWRTVKWDIFQRHISYIPVTVVSSQEGTYIQVSRTEIKMTASHRCSLARPYHSSLIISGPNWASWLGMLSILVGIQHTISSGWCLFSLVARPPPLFIFIYGWSLAMDRLTFTSFSYHPSAKSPAVYSWGDDGQVKSQAMHHKPLWKHLAYNYRYTVSIYIYIHILAIIMHT